LTAVLHNPYSSATWRGNGVWASIVRLPYAPAVHLFTGAFTMGQQANTGKSTKQQPAGKGQPQPKKGK
jgi:alpha-N-acetylglucosamine transferase